jgi:fructokinase
MSEAVQPEVICFGEILWDLLPGGRALGGAPANAAFHLGQLGVRTVLASAVGCDAEGDALLVRARQLGLAAGFINRIPGRATGSVRVELDSAGQPRYHIATNVAWDWITLTPDLVRVAVDARAVVFGSLALRGNANRGALDRLLAVVPSAALRVFDVNLRPPHDNLTLVSQWACRANLLKTNLDEARRLAGEDSAEKCARVLALGAACPGVCVTDGANGAGLLWRGVWHREPGRPVAVRDTVGCGDAFLAALVAGLLRDNSPSEALAAAARLGEFVATQSGATPVHPPKLKRALAAVTD